ncbi:MAG TPA: cytochrome C551 [bacterium]|nr:cytochrome C551 [bacterium]
MPNSNTDPNVVETRICRECSTEFAFTKRDKEFYNEQGWTTRPNRCKNCRLERKMRNEKN